MVKQTLTQMTIVKKISKTGNKVYRSPRIYLSTKLVDDSRFPFRDGDILMARIVGRKVILQRQRTK